KEELDSVEILTLIDFAKRAGGINYAYDTMRRLASEAATIIKPLGSAKATAPLRDILDYIIERHY
ncbi:MAG: hypothetical protein NC131_17160, partial [Roseburia sp.]|nr:hypothetical protein [Roseburia sp.]